jgi:hypothetical protein
MSDTETANMQQPQNPIIDRLRQLKQKAEQNNALITNLKTSQPAYSYSYNHPYSARPIYIDQYNTNTDLYSQMMQDFETRNKHIIESQLQYERGQELLSDVLAQVDEYDETELDTRLSNINIHEFNSIASLKKAIPQPNHVKTVHIHPVVKLKKETESGPELDDLSEYEQQLIGEYIDTAYTHLIKVMKVYFILADGKSFRLPATNEIITMKELLQGHLHVADIDVKKGLIRAGTHVFYLTVDDDSQIRLHNGYVLKTANTGLILIDEENNKKKHIDFKCPVFRKINNLDIAIYIKKHFSEDD